MSIYIKVNQTESLAIINGIYNGRTWDGRGIKTVILTMTTSKAAASYFEAMLSSAHKVRIQQNSNKNFSLEI